MSFARSGSSSTCARSTSALRAGVSTSVVWRIEHARLDEVSLPALLRVAEALEIRLDLVARWRGGELDRVLSAAHAAFAESVVALLESKLHGRSRPEVSFSRYGERGIIDLLAWHGASRTLLVIELKTEIVDVGETLGTLDRKRRLAWQIAADLGWRPDVIAVALLITDTRTNHRRVATHEQTFRAALPGRHASVSSMGRRALSAAGGAGVPARSTPHVAWAGSCHLPPGPGVDNGRLTPRSTLADARDNGV